MPPESHPLRGALGALGLAVALCLVPVRAQGQTCVPSTTPCQVCPPTPCTPNGTLCVSGNVENVSLEATETCSGSSAQTTVVVQTVIGPATVCVGPNRSQACTLPPGDEAVITEIDSITVATALVPTLSLWGLGALVALLGAFGLRRLGTAASPPTAR